MEAGAEGVPWPPQHEADPSHGQQTCYIGPGECHLSALTSSVTWWRKKEKVSNLTDPKQLGILMYHRYHVQYRVHLLCIFTILRLKYVLSESQHAYPWSVCTKCLSSAIFLFLQCCM